jgi:hypothetical protein
MKQSVIKWQTKKKLQMNTDIVSIEQQITDLFAKSPTHIFEAEDMDSL